jgi:hypothetical protein
MKSTTSIAASGASNRRIRWQNFLMFFFAVGLMLSLQVDLCAQKKAAETPVFEIEKYTNPGGGGMGRRFSSSTTFYFYKSGRIACKTLSYDPRGKAVRTNKPKCLQTSRAKMNDLTELAEKPDFLEAKDSYRFFNGGVDFGKSFSITYFRKNAAKKIYLTNPRRSENDVPLPESLTLFLKKIAEIAEDLEVKYELSK